MRKHLRHVAALAMAVGSGFWTPATHAQNEPYIGQLMMTAANYCPRGWEKADGQVLSIASNTPLFSLLGTTYGGNGVNTFRLPDLRGRAPIHVGQGAGLSNIVQGESSGVELVTLTINQMPAHVHSYSLPATTAPATHSTPGLGRVLAQAQNAGIYANATANTTVAIGSTSVEGTSAPVPIRNPYIGMLWCIALEGIYPVRP